MLRALKSMLRSAEDAAYRWSVRLAAPINAALAWWLRDRVREGSVLHVSGMVHTAYHAVRLLRERGVDAEYLAWGDSRWWSRSDYRYRPSRLATVTLLKEMWWVWAVVSRFEIIHAHFMVIVSRSGWEWALLRRMGRRIVVHYRGCEIRDRELNQRLHPGMNICEECDYTPRICEKSAERRRIANRYGNAFIVTTPDLKDFAPAAVHVPFFITADQPQRSRPDGPRRPFKIVHATNHPGIEGTGAIRRAVDSLRQRGFAINFVELQGVTHERVLQELGDADLTIGKMKMGYYANFQVESLAAGVPAVTYVRPEFVTPGIEASGLILAAPETLESTLEYYLRHPDALDAKRRAARASALQLHDNDAIARQIQDIYRSVTRDSANSTAP
jgi:glycosyltransferase involved in cell wall biosynthesis